VMSRYRAALGVKESVPPELTRLGVGKTQAATSQKPKAKSQ